MKLSSLFYAFATFMVALAADAEINQESAPSPLVTIRITLQCRGNDCDVPPTTPVLKQFKDNVLHYTSPANYTTNSTEPQFQGRTTIGELTLNKSLAGTHDFRIDGDHLFKGDQAEHPGSLQTQVYNIACTLALPSGLDRESMHKEVYELDLQNVMEDKFWELEDKIKVKCWKSLPSRTPETDRWSRVDGNQTLPAFQLIIGERCNGGADKVEECKKNNRTLPFISYMKDGLMVATSNEDIAANLTSEPRTSANDMIQVAHLDFDYPTLDYTTQLPAPEIFTVGYLEGEDNYRRDCEIRIMNKPVLETDLIQAGLFRGGGYFDINSKEPGGSFGYCYETILPPIEKKPI